MSYRDFDFEAEGRDDVIRMEVEATATYEPFIYPQDYWLHSEANVQPKDD